MKHLVLLSIAALLLSACQGKMVEDGASASRRFRFHYETTVSDFPADAKRARIWLPLPAQDESQRVSGVRIEASVPHVLGEDGIYGNRMACFEVEAPFPEALAIEVSFELERKAVSSVSAIAGAPPVARLLAPDALAPLSEEARSRAETATASAAGTLAAARGIYDRVLSDVTYDKSGEGWGRGDLAYVCDVGRGNCSDFHTLFIAMARAREIPSLFEIGFPLPADRAEGALAGYHCWAWFRTEDERWRPIDASEAAKDPSRRDFFFGSIDANRVALSRGRDLILSPPQEGPPLNFFVYPYVEVDGRPEAARIEKSFRFTNL